MNEKEAKYEGNSKFMWDGAEYAARPEAEAKQQEYEGNGFEVRIFEEEGKFLVYTRRVVTEIVLEGEAPV